MSGFNLIHIYSSDSGDIKILFCLRKFLHTVTEVRACGTESPAIVRKARYAFTHLANHKKVSLLSDHTRTVLSLSPIPVYQLMYLCIYVFMYICMCMCVRMDGWIDVCVSIHLSIPHIYPSLILKCRQSVFLCICLI